jgi:DNA-binding IclR family transcriptional regulator
VSRYRRSVAVSGSAGTARLARDAWQLPESAWDAIRELSTDTGETVNVFVRHGLVRVCIAQQEGTQALRHVVRIGDELPLWGGATGYVLLIGAPPELIDAVGLAWAGH